MTPNPAGRSKQFFKSHGFGWVGLDWVGLGWVRFGRVGWGRIGSGGFSKLSRIGLGPPHSDPTRPDPTRPDPTWSARSEPTREQPSRPGPRGLNPPVSSPDQPSSGLSIVPVCRASQQKIPALLYRQAARLIAHWLIPSVCAKTISQSLYKKNIYIYISATTERPLLYRLGYR